MITLVEAINFRSLCDIRQTLNPFNILVGPNASGKTTFMDIVSFLSDMLNSNIEEAVNKRARNFEELIWKQQEKGFISLAIEAKLPDEIKNKINDKSYQSIRYEITFCQTENKSENGKTIISEERLLLLKDISLAEQQLSLFPRVFFSRKSFNPLSPSRYKRILSRDKNSNFSPENSDKKKWAPSFKFSKQLSALSQLPADEEQFPAAIWFRDLIAKGVQTIVLNSHLIRESSAPKLNRNFLPDGSNLPWVVQRLKKNNKKFQNWIDHIRSALPEISGIDVQVSMEDKYAKLIVIYENGVKVPSWLVSDGTLRFLALTLPAYIDDFEGIYLIEEPENGMHPKVIESIYQSLSNVYNAQILLATHSPIVINCAKPEQLLCFAKNSEGATDIVNGFGHPQLKEWKKSSNLGLLFASGVLG